MLKDFFFFKLPPVLLGRLHYCFPGIAALRGDSLQHNPVSAADRKSVELLLNSLESRERNVLFNAALNSLYLRLYGVGLMVKDHSDSERGNPRLPLHGLLFPINSKESFICTIPQTG